MTVLPTHLPVGLHEPAVAYDGRWVWIFGGLTSTGQFSDAVLKFDPDAETLEVTPYRLPFGRQASAAVAFGGQIYVFGGRSTMTVLMTDIVKFDPSTGQFTPVSAALPTGRYNMAAVATSTRIFLFGGYDYTAVDDVLEFHPVTSSLTTRTSAFRPQFWLNFTVAPRRP